MRKGNLKDILATCAILLALSIDAKAQQPELIVQTGHTSVVLCGAFSPNGKVFASGSLDHTIKLWDVESGQELRTLRGHSEDVSSVAFSPDGKTVASGSLDLTLKLWDVGSGQTSMTLRGHTNGILSVVFSPDGNMVASGGFDRTVKLWDARKGVELRTLTGHTGGIKSVALSPDGKTLASAGEFEDKTIKLWNVVTGQELITLPGYPGGVRSVAFSPDGETLASAGDAVKLWNVATGREVRTLQGPPDFIFSVAFSPDGKTLGSAGGKDQRLSLWNVATGELIRTVDTLTLFLAFSPDGKVLASGDGKVVKLWDCASGQQAKNLEGHGKWVLVFASSADGKTLTTGSGDKTIKLWNLVAGQALSSLIGHTGEVSALAFSPDGNTMASGGRDNTIKLWNVSSGEEVGTLSGHTKAVSGVEFSPDSRTLASVSWHGWRDTWSQDGKALSSGFDHGIIKLWDVASGKELKSYEGTFPIAFSPDSRMLASRDGVPWEDRIGRLTLLDVSTGQVLKVLKGHISPVFSLGFSPDQKMLASGGDDKDRTIKLWDAATGREINTLRGHAGAIVRVSFSTDGRILASGSWDKTVRLWDVASGKELESFPQDNPKTAQAVAAVAPTFYNAYQWQTVWPILPGGKIQVELGENGKVNLHEVKTGKLLASLVALDENDWVVVTPDGRFDTNRLENPKGLHWILTDAPLTPLSFEVFLRDYYEPKLLPRLLGCTKGSICDREFKPVRDLTSLNRIQPKVKITKIAPTTTPETVEVRVEAQNVLSEHQKDSRGRSRSSGVYDLRLFRNGQLVGHSTSYEKLQTTFRTYRNFDDELTTWREANRVDLVDGSKTFTFSVRLPANSKANEVEFSAYAFNEDRVKSDTARASYTMPARATTKAKPRAYVIAVGVNANENPAFNLQFAANDARRFQEVLPQRLTATGEYSEVVPITLVSDWELRGGRQVTTRRDATKANFKAVLDLLAGRPVVDEIRNAIPNSEKLRQSTPDDLVLILFSSHGYADRNGIFYFIPYDTGPGACNVFTEIVRQRSISSDEFSLWLRDVDAGQMTLIVDACYSTAAIEGSGFKPGPMGSRGLGQLAYDKRMRILTATQADNVAMELPATADGKPIMHGLLTYALLENGLRENQADFKPHDKTIYLDEWLEFGVANTPKLSASQPQPHSDLPQSKRRNDRPRFVLLKRGLADLGACEQRPAGPARIQEQLPSLFDFTRRKREVALTRNP